MAKLTSEIRVRFDENVETILRTGVFRCANKECGNNLLNKKYESWGDKRSNECNLKTIELDDSGRCNKSLRCNH